MGKKKSKIPVAYQELDESEAPSFAAEPSAPSVFSDLDAEYDSCSEDAAPANHNNHTNHHSGAHRTALPAYAAAQPSYFAPSSSQIVSARVVRVPGQKARERVRSDLVSSAPPLVVSAARVVAPGEAVGPVTQSFPVGVPASGAGVRVVGARVVKPGSAVAASSASSSSSSSGLQVISARVVSPGRGVVASSLPSAYPGAAPVAVVTSSAAVVGQPLPLHHAPTVVSAKVVRAGPGFA